MDNILVHSYLSLIDRLDMESKLTLLSALTDNIKESFKNANPKPDKLELLNRLYGSWKDVNESIIDDIYSQRSVSDREITFD